ncbi:Uncharacterized protein FWK35_00036530 [Aphis craccivora]|uniref:Uncharacterized protein n=1 Tax=Aphis craccivora TaxID=307492 RepID=A0A6G0W1X2_APHCR|nr:Uncharacterized protein FWK35_00036530 [Aphis craccivora]
MHKFDRESILKKSPKGNIALRYFNKNNLLSEGRRKNIVETVVEHLIENKIHASPKCMENIADSIVKLFNVDVKIDIDFEFIYPDKSNHLFDNWSAFVHKVITFMTVKIKDGHSKNLLKQMLELP